MWASQFIFCFLSLFFLVNSQETKFKPNPLLGLGKFNNPSPKCCADPTVAPNSLSFVVALFEIYAGVYYHFCDGVLISPRHILTVASCANFRNTAYRAVFGMHNRGDMVRKNVSPLAPLTDPSRPPVEHVISAASVKMHPEYAKNPALNDIAIITLDSPVIETSYIKKACVGTVTSSKNIFLTGWGQSSCNSMPKHLLTRAPGHVLENTNCGEIIKPTVKAPLADSQLCLTFNNSNFYMGELGAPLYSDLGQGNFEVLGLRSSIVPDGTGCYNKNVPFLFTRFDKHKAFIDQVVGSESSCQNGCENTAWKEEYLEYFCKIMTLPYCSLPQYNKRF